MNFKKTFDSITRKLNGLADLDRLTDAFLSRRILPLYRTAQMARFRTMNADRYSAGGEWAPLASKRYADYKKRRFASYKGRGTKLMIATGDLLNSVLGQAPHGRMAISNSKLVIGSSLPYFDYHNEGGGMLPRRALNAFSDEYDQEVKRRINRFVKPLFGKGK